ncbi:hypothetical protein ACFCWY_19925 [Streptomyces sp. NPDC056362]|uniref:NucA/NucB deoxyribonuclease domain-containing protein n=1 Tax=unclassified Streptomyces TaxID=2593676 RepID=UPI0035E13A6F
MIKNLLRGAAVLSLALTPLAQPAQAAPSDWDLHTSVLPVGTKLPSLADLQRGARTSLSRSAGGFDTSQKTVDVVGPAASFGRPAEESASVTDTPTVTYPAPARTMTPDECIRGLGTDKRFFIKSRYAACSGAVFFTVWSKNNQPSGETQFVYLSIGTIAKDSREVRLTQHFTRMSKAGEVATSGLMIKPTVKVSQTWPSTAHVGQSGTIPGARSFDALARQQATGFTRSLNASGGQGSGRDDVISAVAEASATITPPPGYRPGGDLSGTLFFLPPRWDKAPYLKVPAGAAVFSYAVPLHYSTKQGAPERAVAEHIKTAFTAPGRTKPANRAKNVAGQSPAASLNRLYYDNTRRKKNRSTAVATCKREFGTGYAAGGKECDEYPFATTYQGCAQSAYETGAAKNNFSVKALPKADNGNAGNLLGQFMTLNRIIDGKDDAFYVSVS